MSHLKPRERLTPTQNSRTSRQKVFPKDSLEKFLMELLLFSPLLAAPTGGHLTGSRSVALLPPCLTCLRSGFHRLSALSLQPCSIDGLHFPLLESTVSRLRVTASTFFAASLPLSLHVQGRWSSATGNTNPAARLTPLDVSASSISTHFLLSLLFFLFSFLVNQLHKLCLVSTRTLFLLLSILQLAHGPNMAQSEFFLTCKTI